MDPDFLPDSVTPGVKRNLNQEEMDTVGEHDRSTINTSGPGLRKYEVDMHEDEIGVEQPVSRVALNNLAKPRNFRLLFTNSNISVVAQLLSQPIN